MFCPDEVEKYVDPDGWLSIQSVKLFAGKFYLDHSLQCFFFLTEIRWRSGKLGKCVDRPVY